MKPQRRLALRTERLGDLESSDLRRVAGGTHIFTDCGCVTHGLSCDDCRVPTLPFNECYGTVIVLTLAGGTCQ